ncbi:hypothetical protein PRIPAC_91012 [Pristionchus pacificus]|uniref:Uncharacterized protein n=1 Tax=Pristionchus pacificus TaxID=54126 RepID=A0A2A6B9M5_PRIPA|nr:hypothetical protein PRIPAC_91012 [Pristionchus pacificus]|eukprot:PDM62592.1 hypothetical protein PRIPAC_52034 [Pristionchus pacificus]
MDVSIRLLFMVGIAGATTPTTCYSSITTSDPYPFLDRELVETKGGCEVLCDGRELCAGFAFKDNGLNSSCVMLKNTTNQVCAAQTTMFLKKYTGCSPRTNITEEYGVDLCLDEWTPSAAVGVNPCTPDQAANYFFVRVVTPEGRRKSMFYNHNIEISFRSDVNMWYYSNEKLVAAVCASAGSEKCPCAPLTQSTVPGKQSYAVVPNRINPCVDPKAVLICNNVYSVAYESNSGELSKMKIPVKNDAIHCKAGTWFRWEVKYFLAFPIIVRLQQESLESMRLISHKWNQMAIEHLRNRKLLPCIKYFRRVIEFNENKFVLKIPVGYGNYFGVDNWLSNETPTKQCVCTDMTNQARPNYKQLFARCSSIKKFELLMNMVDCVEVTRIKYSLGNVIVHELVLPILWSVTYRFKNESAVLDLLRTRSFRNLILTEIRIRSGTSGLDGDIAQSPFCGFVLEALTLVSSVKIRASGQQCNMDHWRSVVNGLNEIEGIEAKLSFKNIYANNATTYQICMSGTRVPDFTLANLPSDIVRTILRDGQESIEQMKLISHRRKDLASEHFTNRTHLPLIYYLRWTISNFLNTIFISIPQDFQQYFGVDNWSIETMRSIVEVFEYPDNSVNVSRNFRPRNSQHMCTKSQTNFRPLLFHCAN